MLSVLSGIFLPSALEKCLQALLGPFSAVYFPIAALSSGVYSLYLPLPCFSSAFLTVSLTTSFSFKVSDEEGFAVLVSLEKYLKRAIVDTALYTKC